jgi:ADP-heptose:LPS heptosyltransferase
MNVIISTEPKWLGLGDVMWFLPTVKKLSLAFEQKIDVVTQYPQVFVNNPYVKNIYLLDTFDISSEAGNHYFFRPFSDDRGILWFNVNNKQLIANRCRLSLMPHEEEMEFFPNCEVPKDLPAKYILLNASKRGADRDLGEKNWQKLVDLLNSYNIPVVVEGPEKDTHDLKIKNGVNLRGKTRSLSETWHIINQSSAFVSFDTGMYILAGTTKAQIFLINSYFEPHWHKPFRNGSYDYKFDLIDGSCSEKCMSNFKYYITEEGLQQFKPQICPLGINFKCIPTVEKISQKLINYWKSIAND